MDGIKDGGRGAGTGGMGDIFNMFGMGGGGIILIFQDKEEALKNNKKENLP